MSIFEALKEDHAQLRKVLSDLSLAGDSEVRRELITKVRDLLVPHSRAEEAVLYNVLREESEAKDTVAHSYQEHVMAEALLRGLQITEAIPLNWHTGVKKLIDELEHHIAHEEGTVFAAAKRCLSTEEAVQMGIAFKKLKSSMGAGVLSSQVELMENLMPARFRERFHKILNPKEGSSTRQAS